MVVSKHLRHSLLLAQYRVKTSQKLLFYFYEPRNLLL